MKAKSIKVIFDTNVWISFLIGRRLHILRDYIVDGRITIVVTELLLIEIREVAKRPIFKKYFPPKKVNELIDLLEIIALMTTIDLNNTICKDPKDNFLLDLIESSKADILVTGDKDLLTLNPFKTARIIAPAEFEQFIKG